MSMDPQDTRKGRRRAPTAFKLNAENVRLEDAIVEEPLRHEAMIVPDQDDTFDDRQAIAPEPKPPKSRWGRVLTIGAGGLLSLGIGLAIDSLIRDLFARYEWLGWTGVALLVLASLGLVGFIIKEWRGLSRLSQIDHLQDKLKAAAENNNAKAATSALNELMSLYADRPETAHGRKTLQGHMQEIIDGRDLVKLAERDLLAPLDARATKIVMESAKRVSVVTAISPRAIIDIGIVFYENLRVVSRISRLYGGRPGVLGFMRLTRHVATHLAVTGGMAAGDHFVEQFIGQGLAARLSARLGEGVVNGYLTSRIGVAAIQTCRPSPFIATKGPALTDFISEIMRSSEKAKPDIK
ncbi:TIGR01620 family protein [Pseudovibrio exalbescens]|uniref:YcjF family protein n=1 Tax=Pseudovibrio exalbescens TaxID=197461 RepID=UPI00236704ED|nr:TIGR01620 family protein [Pseudovibrio exalbescens]MDD7910417.1 TIGR01620 family protein [Pseudovibrio exalbescens]